MIHYHHRISFLIANWTTIFITLDNLSDFQQNVCDGMMCDDIFLLRRLMKMLSISHFFARDVYIITGPKIRLRGK